MNDKTRKLIEVLNYLREKGIRSVEFHTSHPETIETPFTWDQCVLKDKHGYNSDIRMLPPDVPTTDVTLDDCGIAHCRA